ncbi:hypothetical protein EDD37DRAFT_456569 [Exophiala viscosa]|uniref:NADH dehydrogenase [ubiquinone] 1 alpha subcomplex subunit n=1 Tax=Exophiala viscosa TaxID=2486360 RepID=A0AAN6DUW6_9EURO|nr:hypothetical protein EDD36DRAFT_419925 [Exophiala viscosa]KAI1623074.1 hypothetical protein EDD37DRAFT_456569 [Exophiala viscosa]
MGAARDLWVRWKMLRLPWRKKFLVGQDLSGNTFWEFKDVLNTGRWRRIVQADRHTHYSDVKISPQWHQWLRQTRVDPPSVQEQVADIQRMATLKQNARLADERWAAKAKYIEKPKPAVTPQLSGDPQVDRVQAESMPGQPPREQKTQSAVETPKAPPHDPWKEADETAPNPGAKWSPESWVPPSTKR